MRGRRARRHMPRPSSGRSASIRIGLRPGISRRRPKPAGSRPSAPSRFTREDWLHLLMAEAVEPRLGMERPHFLYDFPSELSALARVRKGAGEAADVAERFEVFFRGMELANGYHELTDASEQRRRFLADLESRRTLGRAETPIDERMIRALEQVFRRARAWPSGSIASVMIAASAGTIGSVDSFLERAGLN